MNKTPQNAIQHGGQHYKKLKIEIWDFIAANEIPYMEGQIIRYAVRWRDKGGMEDLFKLRHYVEKLIELEMAKPRGLRGAAWSEPELLQKEVCAHPADERKGKVEDLSKRTLPPDN